MADYAVVILGAMAREPQSLLSAGAIAQFVLLPEPTVSKILKILGRHGLVKSTRGTMGGYALAAAPKKISIAAIIQSIDGPIALTACKDGQEPDCGLTQVCALRGRWDGVNTAIIAALEGVSLADMAGKTGRRADIKPRNQESIAHGRH